MAEKTEERVYTIPLRDAWLTPRTRRAKQAVMIVRSFLQKHMKSDNVKIGTSINDAIWKRGIQHPPRCIKVHATKHDGAIYSELVGTEIKLPTAAEEKRKKEKKEERVKRVKEERKERRKTTLEKEVEEEKLAGKRKEKKEEK